MTQGYQLPMRIAFRTDASIQIGSGHVMRCLTLADALRDRGAECQFICRPHTGHLLGLIAQRNHKVVALNTLTEGAPLAPTDPAHAAWLGTDWMTDAQDTRQSLGDELVDWLVVDHYALDRRWEQTLRPACQRLMVIDDLADRPHDCDLLLDQNLGRTATDYSGRLPDYATALIGPQYALLRPEFAQLRAESLARRGQPQLKHVLITMGGVDKGNATGCVLDALNICALPSDMHITVVMGPDAPWLQQVQTQAAQMRCPTQVLVGANNMARLMADSDLAIGAVGGTAWERCCLGLPSLILVLADNQQDGAVALQKMGAVMAINGFDDMQKILQKVFREDIMNSLLLSMGQAAQQVTHGQGVDMVLQEMAVIYA